MLKLPSRLWEILIGVVACTLPFIALGYKFGLYRAFLIFLLAVTSYLVAKLAIHLFARRSNWAKAAAILLEGELLFMFFMPKALKQKIKNLDNQDQASSQTDTGYKQ